MLLFILVACSFGAVIGATAKPTQSPTQTYAVVHWPKLSVDCLGGKIDGKCFAPAFFSFDSDYFGRADTVRRRRRNLMSHFLSATLNEPSKTLVEGDNYVATINSGSIVSPIALDLASLRVGNNTQIIPFNYSFPIYFAGTTTIKMRIVHMNGAAFKVSSQKLYTVTVHNPTDSAGLESTAKPNSTEGRYYIRSGLRLSGTTVELNLAGWNHTAFERAVATVVNDDRCKYKQGEYATSANCTAEFSKVKVKDVKFISLDTVDKKVIYQVSVKPEQAAAVQDRLLHPYFKYPLSIWLKDQGIIFSDKPWKHVDIDGSNARVLTPPLSVETITTSTDMTGSYTAVGISAALLLVLAVLLVIWFRRRKKKLDRQEAELAEKLKLLEARTAALNQQQEMLNSHLASLDAEANMLKSKLQQQAATPRSAEASTRTKAVQLLFNEINGLDTQDHNIQVMTDVLEGKANREQLLAGGLSWVAQTPEQKLVCSHLANVRSSISKANPSNLAQLQALEKSLCDLLDCLSTGLPLTEEQAKLLLSLGNPYPITAQLDRFQKILLLRLAEKHVTVAKNTGQTGSDVVSLVLSGDGVQEMQMLVQLFDGEPLTDTQKANFVQWERETTSDIASRQLALMSTLGTREVHLWHFMAKQEIVVDAKDKQLVEQQLATLRANPCHEVAVLVQLEQDGSLDDEQARILAEGQANMDQQQARQRDEKTRQIDALQQRLEMRKNRRAQLVALQAQAATSGNTNQEEIANLAQDLEQVESQARSEEKVLEKLEQGGPLTDVEKNVAQMSVEDEQKAIMAAFLLDEERLKTTNAVEKQKQLAALQAARAQKAAKKKMLMERLEKEKQENASTVAAIEFQAIQKRLQQIETEKVLKQEQMKSNEQEAAELMAEGQKMRENLEAANAREKEAQQKKLEAALAAKKLKRNKVRPLDNGSVTQS